MKAEILRHACRYDDPDLPGQPVYDQAGALCFREAGAEREILLITSLRTKRMILPKGWSEPGMSLRDTARQEAWEEAGVQRGLYAKDPLGSYLYEKLSKKGDPRICRVHVFVCQVTEMSGDFPEAGRRRLHWMQPGEAAKQVREPALQDILRRF